MKNTDCLCRKMLGWFRENGYQIVAMTSMLLVGYYLRVTLEKHPTLEISFLDKDGSKIWGQYYPLATYREINIDQNTTIQEIVPTLREKFIVADMKISTADRVVVRVK